MKTSVLFSVVRRILLFLALTWGVQLPAPAEESGQTLKHPVKPLLWKIEGNGLMAPSWLFGTIHAGGGPLAKLHPVAQAAFDESKMLFTEIRMDPAVQMALVSGMVRKDGKTLTESIGPELTAQLDQELKRINPEMDAKPFDYFKTWMLATALPVLSSQIKGEKALDQLLWDRAKSAGKKVSGLERSGDQLKVFDSFSEPEQVRLLKTTLVTMQEDREKGQDSFTPLLEAYVSGEPVKVVEVLKQSDEVMERLGEKELSDRFMKRLLTDRDVSMAATITRHLKKEPGRINFFAVGAGHVCPDVSIRSHLEKEGFTVTRVGNE